MLHTKINKNKFLKLVYNKFLHNKSNNPLFKLYQIVSTTTQKFSILYDLMDVYILFQSKI